MGLPTLEELAAECWRLLEHAPGGRDTLFRTPVLASVGEGGTPESRTVVLRAADPVRQTLTVFTDQRSAKAFQLAADPRVSLVFYDPASAIQLRVWGKAEMHAGDGVARTCWDAAPTPSRLAYSCAPGPGEPLGQAGSGIPEGLDDAAIEAGYLNFLVVTITVRRLAWLRLDRTGNLSARFEWDGTGGMSAAWIVP